jgi:hypothetical protein
VDRIPRFTADALFRAQPQIQQQLADLQNSPQPPDRRGHFKTEEATNSPCASVIRCGNTRLGSKEIWP